LSKKHSRARKALYILPVAVAAALLWFPVQRAIHRYQLELLMSEPLAKRLTVLQMRSKALRRVNTVFVYTPPGYSKSGESYPVVYLLHGSPGQASDWFVKARAHETAEKMILSDQIKPVILVSFDGYGPGGTGDHAEFLNSVHGSVMVEDYVADELPRFIDKKFRTIRNPNARALVGLSSGGYGAINIGTKHQYVYRVLASHSGYFDPHIEPRPIQRMLGPDGSLWDANNPHKQVSKWRGDPDLHIYLDCGRTDQLFRDNQQLDREMTQNGIRHVFHIIDGGHRWSLWRLRFHESLRYCDSRFEELDAR
jgi:putative tributyrin esterase